MEELAGYNKEEYEDLVARLPAVTSGAPALRALQLVLPINAAEGGLGPLWRGLEALPNLVSLALGCVFGGGEPTAHMGERIAAVLDAAQVGLLPTCRHAGRSALVWHVQGFGDIGCCFAGASAERDGSVRARWY